MSLTQSQKRKVISSNHSEWDVHSWADCVVIDTMLVPAYVVVLTRRGRKLREMISSIGEKERRSRSPHERVVRLVSIFSHSLQHAVVCNSINQALSFNLIVSHKISLSRSDELMVPKDSCSFMVPECRARARPRMSHVVIKFSAKDGDKMREVGRRLHKLWRRCPCFSYN